MKPRYTIRDITDDGDLVTPISQTDLLNVLSALGPEDIVVGGQSLSIWVLLLAVDIPTPDTPSFITKDVDILSSAPALFRIQAKLPGSAIEVPPKEQMTALVGEVKIRTKPSGYSNVDVLHCIVGSTTATVTSHAVQVIYEGHQFTILHPVDVLKTRLDNLVRLASKRNPHGIKQLEVAILMVNAFLTRELTALPVHSRPTQFLKTLERVCSLIESRRYHRTATLYGLSLLDALPMAQLTPHPALVGFTQTRLPRLQAKVARFNSSPSSLGLPPPRPV